MTSIVDPASDNRVRFTDNSPKEGDLPGIDPTNKTYMELVEEVAELIGKEDE